MRAAARLVVRASSPRSAPRARLVWHQGFEDAAAARELAAEIKRLRAQARDDQRERLATLLREYEERTGEPLDDDPTSSRE